MANCTNSKLINYNDKTYACSLAFTLQLIGDKYKSLIIFHLKDGAMRSGELQKVINGISNRMFTYSIRALEKDGLVERKVYPSVPPKVTYELTDAAKSLVPILLTLDEWGKNFAKDHYLYAPTE